jgi:putative ABC transport system ATP-binding protein
MALANEVERTTACSSLIGFVFQTFELIDHRTASENVELPLVYHGLSPRQRQRRAFETLRRVGLAHRAHAYPPTLSGGEKQRVAVARSVVGEPELILCDEPTGNLDDGSTASVLELLAELNGEGLTIVVATHDPRVASRAHRELAVSDGRILR